MTEPSLGVRRADELIGALRALVADGELDVPPYGGGRTRERLLALSRIATNDLALARVAEAHLDAITILHEAGRSPEPDALYGVWASDSPRARLRLTRRDGRRFASGSKAFCTGAGLLDRALVTVHDDHLLHLVDLDLRRGDTEVDTTSWVTSAFRATQTATITLGESALADDQFIGPPGWYLERIGFWHGALAPAACWAGGAIGLADHCLRPVATPLDDHLAAHLGVLDSTRWALQALVAAAGDAVDAQPHDRIEASRLAHRVRSTIERLVTDVVDHAIRGLGPRLLAADAWAAERLLELQLYVRQHHDTRDHAALARLVVTEPSDLAGSGLLDPDEIA